MQMHRSAQQSLILSALGIKNNHVRLTKPHDVKKMGTSGLRLTQDDYNRPLFFEQFIEGIARYFESVPSEERARGNNTILIGGDPRQGNTERVLKAAEILVAHGFKVQVAKEGLASTPAMSHAIRHAKALGGVILTASHNPWTDVGVKVNMASGAPALENTVNAVHQLQNEVRDFCRVDYAQAVSAGMVTEFDAIQLYANLLDSIFDFQDMQRLLVEYISRHGRTPRLAFDAMAGAAGPFAREIFGKRLGLHPTILREQPDEYLGGNNAQGHPLHPEPDFDFIPELIKLNATLKYDLVSAWDADVDRRLNGGTGFWLESADEFALFAKYGDLIGIKNLFTHKVEDAGTIYFCRSTVTAHAIDLMEPWLSAHYAKDGYKVRIVETPTGFKWIADLGNWGVEESNGVGNPYLREKDGIFASTFLLKIMLRTGQTAKQLMEEIWKETGRVYFTRGEVSGNDPQGQVRLTEILNSAAQRIGQKFAGLTLEAAESWDYTHPVTGQVVDRNAAWVLKFSDGVTVKARFSGTGSGGYLLRVYGSKFDRRYDLIKSEITQPMKAAFNAFLAANGFESRADKFTDANQPDPYKPTAF